METTDIACLGVCALVSLVLIVRLWWKHHEDRLLKKLLWSVALLLPVGGWFLFAGLYRPPEQNTIRARANEAAFGAASHHI